MPTSPDRAPDTHAGIDRRSFLAAAIGFGAGILDRNAVYRTRREGVGKGAEGGAVEPLQEERAQLLRFFDAVHCHELPSASRG